MTNEKSPERADGFHERSERHAVDASSQPVSVIQTLGEGMLQHLLNRILDADDEGDGEAVVQALQHARERLGRSLPTGGDALPRQPDCVKVTAADFNGESWDGSPFSPSPVPGWLLAAIRRNDIRVIPGDRDYAIFEVATPDGPVRALPGDTIQRHPRSPFHLTVVERHPDSARFLGPKPVRELTKRERARENEQVIIAVTGCMKRRWAEQFLGMVREMQRLGSRGSSRNVALFSDGDGDFRPVFSWTGAVTPAEGRLDGHGNFWFDAG